MGVSIQPSTASFAPRQFAGRRPPSLQGDGSPQANGLSQPRQPQFTTSHPPAPQPHPSQTPQPGTSFAQMQASGQARPNPPSAMAPSGYVNGSASQASPMGGAQADANPPEKPADWGQYTKHIYRPLTDAELTAKGYNLTNPDPTSPWTRPSEMGDFMETPDGQAITTDQYDQMRGGNLPTANGQGGYNWSFAAPQGQDRTMTNGVVTPMGSGGVQGDLQGAIQQALAQPSRFDASAYKTMRDASMGSLKQQFGQDQQQLDEDMARRGLGASTIGSQYQTNLKGQQDTAMAGVDSSLLKDAADNWAADRSSAIGSAQAFQNSQDSNSQFAKSLAQQLGIAQMGDKTQNRSIDAQSALANNDLMLRVMAALGLGGGSSTGTGSTTTTSTNPAGDPPGTIRNPDGTIVRSGGSGATPGGLPVNSATGSKASDWYWDANGNLRQR